MTRVKIDTPGVSVEIDGEGDPQTLGRLALRLFNKAGGWPRESSGPAIGFSAERRYSYESSRSSMDHAPRT